jgi:hypothetical protein
MNLIEKLESYEFECEAGPLAKCVDWGAIKEIVDLWVDVDAPSPAPQRYSIHTPPYGKGTMIPDDDGDWCRWSDVTGDNT